MKTIHSFITALLFAAAFMRPDLTISAQTKPDHDLLEEVKKAIAESNAIYFQAFARNDQRIFIDRYADDACIMAPFAPLQCGKENAAFFFRIAYNEYGMRNGKFITTAIYGNGQEYVTEKECGSHSTARANFLTMENFWCSGKKPTRGGRCSVIHLAAITRIKKTDVVPFPIFNTTKEQYQFLEVPLH